MPFFYSLSVSYELQNVSRCHRTDDTCASVVARRRRISGIVVDLARVINGIPWTKKKQKRERLSRSMYRLEDAFRSRVALGPIKRVPRLLSWFVLWKSMPIGASGCKVDDSDRAARASTGLCHWNFLSLSPISNDSSFSVRMYHRDGLTSNYAP